MKPTGEQTTLAYKGLDGVPMWILVGIVIVLFVGFAVSKRKGR